MKKWLGLLACLMLSQPVWGAEKAPTSAVERPTVRALHFVLRGVPLDKAYWMVDEAKRSGLNTIVVLVTDGVSLKYAPWRAKQGAWSRDEFKAWVKHAQGKGMQVVPELKLLTHQEKLFQDRYPGLMFNRDTYDPRKDEVYQLVFPLLDEVIELIRPRAIHIGHDEVAGFAPWSWNKRLNPNPLGEHERMLPGDLFQKDVLEIHTYLKQRGIETWMWGDMLISPEEFPEMLARNMNGTKPGYGKLLREKLPKDIVICDWHYGDDQAEFTSLSGMQNEGFRVIGATWKKTKTIKNFSHYSAQHGTYGMMATTWFHVQRKEWDVVGRIIRTSGRIFNKDFPDVQ